MCVYIYLSCQFIFYTVLWEISIYIKIFVIVLFDLGYNLVISLRHKFVFFLLIDFILWICVIYREVWCIIIQYALLIVHIFTSSMHLLEFKLFFCHLNSWCKTQANFNDLLMPFSIHCYYWLIDICGQYRYFYLLWPWDVNNFRLG